MASKLSDVLKVNIVKVSINVPESHNKMLISRRIVRILLGLIALGSIAWAFVDPRFRNAEGLLTGSCCLPMAAGLSLMIVAAVIGTRFQGSGFWLSLALLGQAVALQIIDAGLEMKYQHYRPLNHPALLAFLGVQTVLVAVGYRNHWRQMWSWIKLNFKAWQLLCIGLFFFLSSATVSEDVSFYLVELPFAALIQAINLATIMLVVWTLPAGTGTWFKVRWQKLFGSMDEEQANRLAKMDRFTILAALWVTVLAAIFSFYSYGAHPHISDEVAYVYQARYFATGMLTMPAPPVPGAFDISLMNYEQNRWYSVFPPGWPLVLSIGVWSGVPWLINPILAGLNVLGIAILLRELYDRRTARIVVILLCFSPWFVFMGMNLMSHTFTLTCALASAIALVWARKTSKARWAWASGAAVGMVSLIRPLDGLILALLLGVWAIGIGGRRLRMPSVAALVLGILLVGSLGLFYNKQITGKFTEFPVNAYFDKYYWPNSNAMGFGPERGLGWHIDPNRGHSPTDALINANLNTTSINYELLGWSTGSLLLVALLVFSGAVRGSDWLMIAVIGAVFIAHFFYWFSGGPDFGARYWYLMLVPLMALTARGIQFLQSKLAGSAPLSSHPQALVMVAIILMCTVTLVNYFPWRAIDKYHNYLGLRPDVRYLAQEHEFGKSLVLVQGDSRPDYASAAVYNPLDLQADEPIYAWDQNPEVRSQILRAYENRPVWVIAGPSITGGGFKVIEGPISADKLAARDDGSKQGFHD